MISIIIPIRRGEDISGLLGSIHASTYKDYEVIVVDEGKERSEQRNIGIGKAKGEYLLILDSDQYLHRCLLAECVSLMKGYDALYIPEIQIGKGLFNYIRRWERGFYTCTPVDCVRFVKAPCPLFDTTMSGPEDSSWDREIKGKRGCSYFPFYHHDKCDFKKYLSKKAYYSKSMARYKEKHPDDKVLKFWYRCFIIFFERGKWKKFFARPDLALCVMGLIFLRGVVFLCNKK